MAHDGAVADVGAQVRVLESGDERLPLRQAERAVGVLHVAVAAVAQLEHDAPALRADIRQQAADTLLRHAAAAKGAGMHAAEQRGIHAVRPEDDAGHGGGRFDQRCRAVLVRRRCVGRGGVPARVGHRRVRRSDGRGIPGGGPRSGIGGRGGGVVVSAVASVVSAGIADSPATPAVSLSHAPASIARAATASALRRRRRDRGNWNADMRKASPSLRSTGRPHRAAGAAMVERGRALRGIGSTAPRGDAMVTSSQPRSRDVCAIVW